MNVVQARRPSLSAWLRAIALQPAVQIAVALWVAANAAVLLLAGGVLPFDRPALATLPFLQQVALPSAGLIEVFLLMAVVAILTRRRAIPDLAARAPARAQAKLETICLISYAAVGQVGGWLIGPALGYAPFSFHLAGTLVGCSTPPRVGEVWTWAIYNFVVFAVAPYLWFRSRYSAMDLNLRSTNRSERSSCHRRGRDTRRSGRTDHISRLLQLERPPDPAGCATVVRHLHARNGPADHGVDLRDPHPALPQVDRFVRATVILGGVTYAAMHIVEGWSVFGTPRNIALSLIFVALQYFGPGMIKTVITLRTGNAWVHAIGYHAVAPHILVDTPLIANAFGIR